MALQQLRDIGTYYATNPSAEVPERIYITNYAQVGTDEENYAEINKIATILEVEAQWVNGYYVARRAFGSMVVYEVVAVPSAAIAAYSAVGASREPA